MSGHADIAVWGRVPPPIGGMAVHLERLLPRLEEVGLSVQMYSVGRRTPDHPQVRQVAHRRLRWIASKALGGGEPIHYVFSNETQARFAAACLSAAGRARVVLRVGGPNLERAAASVSRRERWMIRFAVRNATAVVGVNESICRCARELGARRVLHVPGFIPPDTSRDPGVPTEVEAFLARGDGPVLLASGEVWLPEDQDLYGARALLDLLDALPRVRLLFYSYEISPLGPEPFERLAATIRARGLEDRYCLYRSRGPLWPAAKRADLFVRPTLWDGDSNALREALAQGLPVIASDCVGRPAGVTTYPAGDPDALTSAVAGALADLDGLRDRMVAQPPPDNAAPLIELFLELLGRR